MNRLRMICACMAVLATVVLTSGVANGQANIGVVLNSGAENPFGGYLKEILKAEGFRDLQTVPLGGLTLKKLRSYKTIVLSDTSLTKSQADMFRRYVSGGGSLIAMRPDSKLDTVFGLVRSKAKVSGGFIKISSRTPIGGGLETSISMKIHADADLYRVAGGATKVASLYGGAKGAKDTGYAGVVRSSYGAGQAVAFSYDLAKSTVYLRQGNPAWAGEEHDGAAGVKPNDLFYDKASGTYWNAQNTRDGILQADEQMRLLTHSIEATNASRMPLPRLWYFPNARKSVLVWTGDQDGGTIASINAEIAAVKARGGNASIYLMNSPKPKSPVGCYGPMPTAVQVKAWVGNGNEIGVHFDDTAERYTSPPVPTWAGMNRVYKTQMADFRTRYPNAPTPKSLRNHYVVWVGNDAKGAKEFAASAQIEQNHGFKLDFNYHYQGISGQGKTGRTIPTGLPMRFATSKGKVLNIFQANSQVTDEKRGAGAAYRRLLDESLNKGKYSWIVANFHPCSWGRRSTEGEKILDYAVSKGIPIWSGGDMSSFLQMRDAAGFQNTKWDGSNLSFSVKTPVSGKGALTVMVPNAFGDLLLKKIRLGGKDTVFSVHTIAGEKYALFTIGNNIRSVKATYAPKPTMLKQLGGVPPFEFLWGWSSGSETRQAIISSFAPVRGRRLGFAFRMRLPGRRPGSCHEGQDRRCALRHDMR